MRHRATRSSEGGVAWRLGGVALAVLLTAGVTPQSGSGFLLFTTAGTQDTVPARSPDAAVRRPFDHGFHQDLPCAACHGSGATHRLTYVRAPADCAGCHHDPRRALACTKCHAADVIAAPRTARLSLTLPGVESPRIREVTFRHEAHVAPEQGLACGDCHATDVTLARNRECGSCHASHHDGQAECTACHAAPRPGAHGVSVHLSCAGTNCHSAAQAPSPVLSRTLCVFCHQDRKEHEPGGSCALCHRIPGATAPASAEEGLGGR